MDSPATTDSDRPGPICPNCLAGMSTYADFCSRCNSPVSGTSVLDPIKQIHATGWMYRKASSGRPRLFVVIGIWLILGPTVLLMPGAIGYEAYNAAARTSLNLSMGMLEATLAGALALLITLLHLAILWKVTRAYVGVPARRGQFSDRTSLRAWLNHALKTDGMTLVWTGLSVAAAVFALEFAARRWTDLACLLALSLCATLIATESLRLWRRNPMTLLGLLCLGTQLLVMIPLLCRLLGG